MASIQKPDSSATAYCRDCRCNHPLSVSFQTMAAAVTQSFSPAMYTQFSNSFGIPHHPTPTTYAHSVYTHGYHPHLPTAAPPVIPHFAAQLNNTTGQGLVSPVSAEVNSLAYSKKTTPPPFSTLSNILIFFLSSRTILIIQAHKSLHHLQTPDLAVSPHQPTTQPSLPYPPPAPHPCLLRGT